MASSSSSHTHYGELNEPSSSVMRTPPPVSTYPNLPMMGMSEMDVAGKTRKPLGPKEAEDCRRVLTLVFGHSDYKGKQKEIVEAAYCGADVLVVAPTGMGKSLCFQIPAIADKAWRGLTIVVSPLLALMQNQLEALRSRDVEVASLSSQVPPQEREQISRHIQKYDITIKLLYITPEKLATPEFLQMLDVVYENHNLNRLVVDEAHCISEWGHDFRLEYRLLGRFRDRYPDVSIMALTATATSAVQRDMIRSLKLDESKLFVALHPFNRSNLFYEVRYLSNPDFLNQVAEIFDYITTLYRRRGKASSGIIYCRNRKTCDAVSSYLRGKGLSSKPYHRGVSPATLDKTLKSWTNGIPGEGGTVDVVVATIAFGLGIDKGDVRYIIHYDMPKSFEGYYQETGRAGRDGHPAKCILYYSREDAINVKRFVRTGSNPTRNGDDDEPTPTQRASGSLQALVEFAESSTICRHVSICRYFGEPIDEKDEEIVRTYCNRMCDVCKYPDKLKTRIKKLSSREAALATVGKAQTPWAASSSKTNSPAPQSFNNQGSNDWRSRQQENQMPIPSRGSYGAQKRAAPDEGQYSTATKKPKVALPPMLVTKAYGSASGLSKPFRPPTFVQPTMRPKPTAPSSTTPPTPVSNKEPQRPTPLVFIPPVQNDVDGPPDERESSPVDLPDLDIDWQPEHSGKASHGDRQKALDSLRSSFHKVLLPTFTADDIWAKINGKALDDSRRHEIIFQAATDLESNAILLSSTLKGYNQRIDSVRDDIKALSDLDLWDTDDADFEESQEIIQLLRQLAIPNSKGKHRAR